MDFEIMLTLKKNRNNTQKLFKQSKEKYHLPQTGRN